MPTAYLHIGMHKTGTTGFQSFMKTNRTWLASHGLYVPDSGCSALGAHHQMVLALTKLVDNPRLKRLPQELTNEINQIGHPNLLISSETMMRFFKSYELENNVCSFFTDLGYKIVLITALRDAVPAAKSFYTETTKTINYHRSFMDFLRDNHEVKGNKPPHGQKKPLLKYLRRQEQDPIVIPYNAATQQEGIAKTILNHLGIEECVPSEEWLNNSVSDVQIYAARWLGKHIEKTGEPISPLHRPVLNTRMANVLDNQFGPTNTYNPLTEESLNYIKEQQDFEEQNDFAQTYWGHNWDEMFQDDTPPCLETNDWIDNPEQRPPQDRLNGIHNAVLGIWNDLQIEIPFNPEHNAPNIIKAKLDKLNKS